MEHEPLDIEKIKPAIKNTGKDLAGLFDKMQIAVVGKEFGRNDTDSDFEDVDSGSEGEEVVDEVEPLHEDPNFISGKHNKATNLDDRAREDMDFPDEVDSPFVDAWQRFQKYRGIKSIKNCDWDAY